MIEYVFRSSRRVNGKRIVSRLFSGRYSLERGQKPVTVPLDTPDEKVARKRLRDLLVEKQREAAGLIAPRAQREAMTVPLTELVGEYRESLRREVTGPYFRDTINRVLRMINDSGWKFLGDIRPDGFLRWRNRQTFSAKTAKEYHISLGAFLNFLVKVERLERNPLAKLEYERTRGREVRPSRSYTEQELRALFATATERALFYKTLFYTAGRRNEVGSLVWADFATTNDGDWVKFRGEVTKTAWERVVPLHPALARQLEHAKPKDARPDSRIFEHVPTRKQFLRDLTAAGIERKDALGRVVHIHAFRKTARTIAVAKGVSERVCDAVLGHQSSHRMGTRYTDMRGVPLTDWLKLPWLGSADDAQLHSLKNALNGSIRDAMARLIEEVKVLISEEKQASEEWSGRRDSNSRPPGPKPGALPG